MYSLLPLLPLVQLGSWRYAVAYTNPSQSCPFPLVMAKVSGPNKGKPVFCSHRLHKGAACRFLGHVCTLPVGREVSSLALKVKEAVHPREKGGEILPQWRQQNAPLVLFPTPRIAAHCGMPRGPWSPCKTMMGCSQAMQPSEHQPCFRWNMAMLLLLLLVCCCSLTLKITLPGQRLCWHHPTKVHGVTPAKNFVLQP